MALFDIYKFLKLMYCNRLTGFLSNYSLKIQHCYNPKNKENVKLLLVIKNSKILF